MYSMSTTSPSLKNRLTLSFGATKGPNQADIEMVKDTILTQMRKEEFIIRLDNAFQTAASYLKEALEYIPKSEATISPDKNKDHLSLLLREGQNMISLTGDSSKIEIDLDDKHSLRILQGRWRWSPPKICFKRSRIGIQELYVFKAAVRETTQSSDQVFEAAWKQIIPDDKMLFPETPVSDEDLKGKIKQFKERLEVRRSMERRSIMELLK